MTERSGRALLAGCLLVLSVPHASWAQGQPAVTAGVGETADAITGVSTGTSLSLGAAWEDARRGLSLTLGLPLDHQAATGWGSAVGWGDWPSLLRVASVMASAQAFGYRDPVLTSTGAAAAVRAEAYRELSPGPVLVRVRGGGRGGTLVAGDATVRRALWGGGADATVARGPAAVRVSADVWAGPEAVYPVFGATAVLSWGPAVAHGRVERWLHDASPTTGWGAALDIRVRDRLSLVMHAARPATDILFFSPPQRSWSVGIRYGIGAPRPARLPTPLFSEGGEPVRLELPASGAGPVRVAGTFSEWEPVAMTRESERWVLRLRLDPGVYEYAFIGPDGEWFVPEGTPGRKPDGFGGFVATVVVR